MVKAYSELYHGFTIKRKSSVIEIYDKREQYVTRVEVRNIHAAKYKIDEIIVNSSRHYCRG